MKSHQILNYKEKRQGKSGIQNGNKDQQIKKSDKYDRY